jgi:uncharacterized protein YehS (DUF1456 family)
VKILKTNKKSQFAKIIFSHKLKQNNCPNFIIHHLKSLIYQKTSKKHNSNTLKLKKVTQKILTKKIIKINFSEKIQNPQPIIHIPIAFSHQDLSENI